MQHSAHADTPAASQATDGTSLTRVREATTQDLDAVIALRLALLREHPDHPIYGRLRADVSARARELYRTQLRSPNESIFLAERSGEIAGILRCVESIGSPLLDPARYTYISSVYVRPEFRKVGVLRTLLHAAERWSTVRGIDQMRLHNVAGSENAEGAWSALGFEIVEQVRVRDVSPTRS